MKKTFILFVSLISSITSLCRGDVEEEKKDFLKSVDIKSENSISKNDFGEVFLTVVKNKTDFPLEYQTTAVMQNNLIKDGTVIRIQSESSLYADKNPYLKATDEPLYMGSNTTRTLLRANSFDARDSNVFFEVKNVLDDDGKKWITLTSKEFAKKQLCVSTSEDGTLVELATPSQSRHPDSFLWEISGSLDRCFLKNKLNNGFMGPSDSSAEDGSFQGSGNNDSKSLTCCYGDLIVLENSYNKQTMAELLKGSNEIEEKQLQYFVIKGPHSESDRLNCAVGSPIKNGSTIRLENTFLGKNLTIDTKKLTDKELKESGYDKYEKNSFMNIILAGKDGVGSDNDNWIISFNGGNNAVLKTGEPFYLLNFLTGHWLAVVNNKIICETLKVVDQDKEGAINPDDIIKSASQAIGKTNKDQPQDQATNDALKENQPFKITSLKKALLDELNLIRTGYKQGAVFEKIGIERTNNQQLSIEIVSSQQQNIIQAKQDKWFSNYSILKQPLGLKGMIKTAGPEISPGLSVNIDPLDDNGVFWLEKSLPVKNKFCLQFLAKVSEKSALSVVMGNQIGADFIYKIFLGRGNNSYSGIEKSTSKSSKADMDTILNLGPLGQKNIIPYYGSAIPFWLIFDNGLFLMGRSNTIGENIFLAFFDFMFLEQIDRIGFCTADEPATISSIEINYPPTIISSLKQYMTQVECPVFPNFSNKGLRQKDLFTISCDSKSFQEEGFILRSSKSKDFYQITLDFLTGVISIEKNVKGESEQIAKIKNSIMPEKKDRPLNIWLSYQRGRFLIGCGEISKNLLCATQDNKPIPNIDSWAAQKNSSLSYLSSFAQPYLELIDEKNESQKFDFESTKSLIVASFDYNLHQDEDKLLFKEKNSNQTVIVATAPAKGSKYSMEVSIETSGQPKMKWSWQPENADLFSKMWKQKIFASTAEALMFAASHIEGSGEFGQIAATPFSLDLAAAGLAPAFSAAKLKASVDFDYKKAEDQIANEAIKKESINKASATGGVPTIAKVNRFSVETALDDIIKISPNNRNMFFSMLGSLHKIIKLIVHPHVIGTEQIKKGIISKLLELNSYQSEIFYSEKFFDEGVDIKQEQLVSAQNLMFTYSAAIQNMYLLDQSQKKQFINMNNILLRKIMKENPSFEMPSQFGEFLWIESKLPEKGRGRILFEAKGAGYCSVGFASQPINFSNGSQTVYQATFYNDQATSASIKLNFLNVPANETANKELRLNSSEFKKYYAEINEGKITIGTFLETKPGVYAFKPSLTFKDPFPMNNEKFIGFSCWDSSIYLKNITVLPITEQKSAS